MAVTRVARSSVADQLFDQLLGRILAGELPAGSQLPAERELAAQAGVNRQAVREALQRLRQMDLVEIVHGGGVRVNDWRVNAGLDVLPTLLVQDAEAEVPTVARSIVELRATVGAAAARTCAERAPAATADRLRKIFSALDHIGEDDTFRRIATDLEIWDAVVDGTGNVAFRLAFNRMRAAAMAQGTADGYHTLADAIAAGDGEAAEAAARRLLLA